MQQQAFDSREGTPDGASYAVARAGSVAVVVIALGLEILLIEGLLISSGCGQPT